MKLTMDTKLKMIKEHLDDQPIEGSTKLTTLFKKWFIYTNLQKIRNITIGNNIKSI